MAPSRGHSSDHRTDRLLEAQDVLTGEVVGPIGVAGGDRAEQLDVLPDVLVHRGQPVEEQAEDPRRQVVRRRPISGWPSIDLYWQNHWQWHASPSVFF